MTITLNGPVDGMVWKVSLLKGDTLRVIELDAWYLGTGRRVGKKKHWEALYLDPDTPEWLLQEDECLTSTAFTR